MNKVFILILSCMLLFACRNDNRERLFELFYPNFQFTIPAGQSAFLPFPLGIRGVDTNIAFYLAENNIDTTMIKEMSALTARLSSVDGLNYNFLNEISIRICPDRPDPCRDADEVFYIDRLQIDRPGDDIQFLPGLRNVRDELLAEEYRLEIVFFMAFAPAFDYDSQLDMTFGAFR
jgi:hypothetical protein